MKQVVCPRCGNVCLIAEETEAGCRVCGQKLDVYVRALVDAGQADIADLVEEEAEVRAISDDVDCQPE